MAFVSNAPDSEEEKQDPSIAPQGAVSPSGGGGSVHLSPSGGVSAVGGSGAPASGSAPGSPAPSGASPTPAGGQFASLNTYLNANQGQAAPLAGKITSGINNQYNNLNAQDTSTLQGINQQVNANAAPSQDQTNATIAQESANPVSFASNPGNVASFQGLLNASYAGPASAESSAPYQAQQNAVNSAISAGQNAVGTEAGREGLLTQNEATPTTGVTALNSAILSQDPTALGSIESAYQPFSGLLNNLQTGAGTIDQQIAQNQGNATAANQESNAAINNQTNALNTDINTQLGNATTATNAYNAGLNNWQTAEAAQQPFAAALNASGLMNALGLANPYTANYQNMVTPTANTVSTPNQLALENALGTLSGTPITTINPNSPVGTYQAPSAVPTAPNVQNLMDQIAIADYEKANPGAYFGTPNVNNPGGQQASANLDILGNPAGGPGVTVGGVPPGWQSQYNTYVSPFQSLMAQLNSIYGTQYVSPITIPGLNNGNPIAGTYQLNS